MISNETFKNIRNSQGISQEALSRILLVDRTKISKIENGHQKLKLEEAEELLNIFGYTLDYKLMDKHPTKKDMKFYKNKNIKDILNMSNEDITEYLFVNLDNGTLAKICNIDESILNLIPLKELKELLKSTIEIKSKRILYHTLNSSYDFNEEFIIPFVDEVNYYLTNECDLEKSELDKIYYIHADWRFYDDYGWSYDNFKFLDKDKNEINISLANILQGQPMDEYFQDWLSNGIGLLLQNHPTLLIKDEYNN